MRTTDHEEIGTPPQSLYLVVPFHRVGISCCANVEYVHRTSKDISMSEVDQLLTPEVFCEVVSSSKVALGSMAETQLAGEVVVMHMLPQLLSAEEVLVAEAAEGVGGGQVGLQLLLTAKHGQLQREGALSLKGSHTL